MRLHFNGDEGPAASEAVRLDSSRPRRTVMNAWFLSLNGME